MGNPASGLSNVGANLASRFKPQIPLAKRPKIEVEQTRKPGLVSQIIANAGRKPNMQKAQRMNPAEVPTRKLY